jgi:DNA modification methylase
MKRRKAVLQAESLTKDLSLPISDRIILKHVTRLKPWERNARLHSSKQITQLADSIVNFGFTVPLIIDEDDRVLAGHGRLEAAKRLGLQTVPCIALQHLSAVKKRAFILADNKIASNAGWDEELLALELKEILTLDETFDLGLTGFSIGEADQLVEGLAVEEPGNPEDDALPDHQHSPPVTKSGDIRQLGHHRLLCGDARVPENYTLLMQGEKAEMILTDPPYNVPVVGHVSGLGKVKHREFAMASGEMSQSEFADFLENVFKNLTNHSQNGLIHLVFSDWRHMSEMLEAGSSTYTEFKNLIVWVKTNAGMGTFYRSMHELIFAFKSGEAPHINTFELGQTGRYRTDVWNYRGMNAFGCNRDEELALHPTVKPLSLLSDAIKDVSRRSGIVLDVFGGSGSTLIAAQKTGRRARIMEIDPLYCDRIIRRWETYAKDDATLVRTGESFSKIREQGANT